MSDHIRKQTYDMFAIPGKDLGDAAPPLSSTHGPLALISDDCQDVSVVEQMALVVRGVVAGKIEERFISLIPLSDQKAVTIHKALVDKCKSLGIHPSRVCCLGSDGVSTWTGENNGVVALWRKHQNPNTLHVWCTCHKIALIPAKAAESVRGVGQHFNSVLDSLYGLFCQSSPRTSLLQEVQEAMNDPQLKIRRSCETRWVSRDNVTKTVFRSFPALLGYLTLDAFNPTCSDKAKVPGLRDSLMDFEFVATLLLCRDVLPVFTNMLELFQTRDVDWCTASERLPRFRVQLAQLKESDGEHLADIKGFVERSVAKVKAYGEAKNDEVEQLLKEEEVKRPRGWGNVSLEFQRFSIAYTPEEYRKWDTKVRRAWIQALLDQWACRFPEKEEQHCTALLHRLFQADAVPLLASDRAKELKTVYDGFKSFLPVPNSFELLCQQYGTFCTEVTSMRETVPQDTPSSAYMQDWLKSLAGKRNTLVTRLMLLSLTIPVTSAEAERVFSTMNRIKDSERASLGQVMLDNLMVISHTGPTPGQFPFRRVVYDWYKASDRRETLSVAFQNKLDLEFGLVPKDKGKAHKDKAENTPMVC